MAYEFKKLSEIEKLDSVPDGATVLAEVDGVIRRVPSEGLGGGSVSTEKVIEYDFAVSGVPAVKVDNELMAMSLYKVSDETPSLKELQGAVMVQNYGVEGAEDCVATVDVAEAMLANEEAFISPVYQVNMGACCFCVGYVTGEVTANIQGADVTVDIPETGVYVLFDLGEEPPANWKFSLTYKVDAPAGGSGTIPEFDLVAMGLPAVPIGGERVSVACDTTEIMAAMEKGLVKLNLAVDLGGDSSTVVSGKIITGMGSANGNYSNTSLFMVYDSVYIAINISVNSEGISSQTYSLVLA